ncbi:MAG: quinone-dependent dihydroorotate dehydrogenase [Vicingaceae bacterium]
MYKALIRPVLFLFAPEKAHHLTFKLLKIFLRIPLIKPILRSIYSVNDKKLNKNLLGLKFPNPVGLAAGFDKNALLYKELSAFGFGFIEIGTVTPKPQPGNPKPRLFRLPKDQALINRMGFNNLGVDAVVDRLKSKPDNLIVGGNIGKNTATPNEDAANDYVYCFEKLYDYVDYFVVNVSCPNIKGLSKLQDTDFLFELLNQLMEIRTKKSKSKPILLKIAPDLTNSQLDEVVELVTKTKIEGVIAVNTSTFRDNLITPESEIEKIGNGGLSGKPLFPKSKQTIQYLRSKLPKGTVIIGVGGIFSPEDAMHLIGLGADLVQVYTGFIYEGPSLVKKINKKILSTNG